MINCNTKSLKKGAIVAGAALALGALVALKMEYIKACKEGKECISKEKNFDRQQVKKQRAKTGNDVSASKLIKNIFKNDKISSEI